MYKRISHNIVEEHFDHPAAPELKSKLANTHGSEHPKRSGSNNREWAVLNRDISNFVGHVRNYVVSEIQSADDVDYIKNQVLSDVTDISRTIEKHYATNVSDAVLMHLTSVVTSLVSLIAAAKSAKDIEPYKTIVLSHVAELATVLADANPSKWGLNANVKGYLDQYVGYLAEQINARLAQDWAADEMAMTRANNLMCNGPVLSGVLVGKPDFEHVYRSGLMYHNWF